MKGMLKKKRKQSTSKNLVALEAEIIPAEVTPSDLGEENTPIEDSIVIDIEGDTPADSLPIAEEFDVEEPEVIAPLTPVRYDPLGAYLAEISKHRALDREEELEIAKKYYEHRDVEAAYRLVVSNLWLVVKIARDYERAARNLLDVIQEGNIGLMEAVKNFDPYRGVRFPSYASWWVKAYILRYVIANWRMVKIGTTQAQRKLFFNLKKEKERLEREGFYAEPKLLAENLQVRESDIIEMEQRLNSPDVSVSAPIGSDSDLDLLSLLPTQQPNAEDLLEKKQLKNLISQSFSTFSEQLSERDRIIFEERLLGDEKVTLHDLAERFKLSKERVRQLESRVREKLKAFMIEHMGSNLEDSLALKEDD